MLLKLSNCMMKVRKSWACGADLKNTFTITKGKFAIPSQHIGDMENYETVKFFEESLANLKAVYRADPKIIVHDLHPGYLSTKWAIEYGMRSSPPPQTLPQGEGYLQSPPQLRGRARVGG